MDIFVVGLNHTTAPVALREQLAFGADELPRTLTELREAARLDECLILSTCNRVEIYGAVPALNSSVERIHEFLRRRSTLDGPAPPFYTLRQPESIEHLFAVAGGLDSMVLGESEILGQVKRAYEAARAAGTAGRTFHVLFQKALNAAKEVRSETGIGRGGTSVGSLAVGVAHKIFGDLAQRLVLVVGAGKMSRQALQHLTAKGARALLIANRSLAKAQQLAACCEGQAFDLASLYEALTRADIVITSTAAPQPIIDVPLVRRAMAARHQRPLFFIDIAVPRNVESAVGRLENVFLYDIDDLAGLIRASLDARKGALAQGRSIVARKSRLFMEWLDADITAGHARQPSGAGADGTHQAGA